MAEGSEEAKTSGKSKFLSKSKWGKVFREREEHELADPNLNKNQPGPNHTNSFKLNDDVADFLKPSTERAAALQQQRPKLDLAIAQRWPNAHEIRSAAPALASPTPFGAGGVNGYSKPRRRPGLTVTFSRAPPEVIGEGGEETEDPVTEISRLRARVGRSKSARAAGELHSLAVGGGEEEHEGVLRDAGRRRAQTSGEDYEAARYRTHPAPPAPQQQQQLPQVAPRPLLGRTPTGLAYHEDSRLSPPPVESPAGHEAHGGDEIDSRFAVDHPPTLSIPKSRGPGGTLASSDADKETLSDRRRSMRAGEGMAFRRASALVMGDEANAGQESNPQGGRAGGQGGRRDFSIGVQPSPKHYDQLSRPDAPLMSPDFYDSPRSANSPNPFSDLKHPFAGPPVHGSSALQQQQPQGQDATTAAPPLIQRPFPSTHPQPSISPRRQSPTRLQTTQPPSLLPQLAPVSPIEFGTAGRQDSLPGRANVVSPAEATTSGQDYMRALPLRATDPQKGHDGTASPKRRSVILDDPHASRESLLAQSAATQRAQQFYPSSRPNGSSTSLNRHPASPRVPSSSSAKSSPSLQSGGWSQMDRPGYPSRSPQDATYGAANQGLPPRTNYAASRPGITQSPRSPTINFPPSGSSSRAPSGGSAQFDHRASQDYSAISPSTGFSARAPTAAVRQDSSHRLSVIDLGRPPSATPPGSADPAADAAFADFAARVAHMRGVFRLTAEKVQPMDRCSPHSWLRTATWWFLKGKAGLDAALRSRRPDEPPTELLMQPHVDLAKTWWILLDPLDFEAVPPPSPLASPVTTPSNSNPDLVLRHSISVLAAYLKTICLTMARHQALPPHQSLIQGQDTTIWHEYPRFAPDAVAALNGTSSRSSLILEHAPQPTAALDALPLSDTRAAFCYGRFGVEATMSTDEAGTDRVALPAILSLLRGRRDYQPTILIASQNELMQIRIGPRTDARAISWHDVAWKASASTMVVRLPRGYDLTLRMQERDYRALGSLVEQCRLVENHLLPLPDTYERVVFETRLAELQYADSSSPAGTPGAFPSDKLRGCSVVIFARHVDRPMAGVSRKVHRGFRLLVVTDPAHKNLSAVAHEVCVGRPLTFEFLTDASANGMVAMVLRLREEQRNCRILLVFHDAAARQALYDTLNGLTLDANERVFATLPLAVMNIEIAAQAAAFAASAHPALSALEWESLEIVNAFSEDTEPQTVASENLRLLARHAAGCLTDRMNLNQGELLLRLPPSVSTPTLHLLRHSQQDLSLSLDSRRTQPQITDSLTELLHTIHTQSTLRALTFASLPDLHAFQTAITGFIVRFDGQASTFAISRRRMVVPLHKKWTATNVRLQLVSRGNGSGLVVNVLVFMDDFPHADALCFQVKSTDVFELVKGNGKERKPAVRLVDAKFSLPRPVDLDGEEGWEKVKRRFVNLEGLGYAEEHDDVVVGFESEEDRDRFAAALPAETTAGRGLTLKRRI